MRNEQTWEEKIRPIKIKNLFTVRLQGIMLNEYRPQRGVKPNVSFEMLGYFIFGKSAYGKTVQAAAMLLEKEKQMYLNNEAGECSFLSIAELISELKNSFDKAQEGETDTQILDRYRKAPLLVLDDFGTIKLSDWAYQIMYLILNYRYENLLPTIITSNFSLKEIETTWGDERLTSRIKRMCKVLKWDKWE